MVFVFALPTTWLRSYIITNNGRLGVQATVLRLLTAGLPLGVLGVLGVDLHLGHEVL